jgi:hypothetical protein
MPAPRHSTFRLHALSVTIQLLSVGTLLGVAATECPPLPADAGWATVKVSWAGQSIAFDLARTTSSESTGTATRVGTLADTTF